MENKAKSRRKECVMEGVKHDNGLFSCLSNTSSIYMSAKQVRAMQVCSRQVYEAAITPFQKLRHNFNVTENNLIIITTTN